MAMLPKGAARTARTGQVGSSGRRPPRGDPRTSPPPSPDACASCLQIRRAYRNLASKQHPDKGGDVEAFRSLQQAYEVLSDGGKRREYDATGRVVKTVEEEFMDRWGRRWC